MPVSVTSLLVTTTFQFKSLETTEIPIFYMVSQGMLKLLTWNNLVEENNELGAY